MDALLSPGRRSRSALASGEQPHEAIDGAAEDQVGHEGEQRCGEKHLQEVDALVNNDLIDGVKGDGDKEGRSHVLPPTV